MTTDTVIPRPAPAVPVERLAQTFQRFTEISGISGILLLFATIVALIWANSPLAHLYDQFLHLPITVGIDGLFTMKQGLLIWVDDGLMTIFFFLVGLEIKRELLIGELSTPRQAALPILAAIGGMAVPALIYTLFNAGGAGAVGWGIPMATDIAFSLGVLSLLGRRVPVSLKIFLTAFAIADDLGAVLVIAIFYTETLAWNSLLIGLAGIAGLALFNRAGGRALTIYTGFAIVSWLGFFHSGVHATIAGVLAAMTIPVHQRINSNKFLDFSNKLLHIFQKEGVVGEDVYPNSQQRAVLRELERACELVETPLHRLEHMLQPWVSFAIMPLFALVNAGVHIDPESLSELLHPVSLGIILGLVVGKLVGISLTTFLAVRLKLATLPSDATWPQIIGISALGGMGFTMSLFVAGLAFGQGHAGAVHPVSAEMEALHSIAKIGILTASTIAGLLGALLLHRAGRDVSQADAGTDAPATG